MEENDILGAVHNPDHVPTTPVEKNLKWQADLGRDAYRPPPLSEQLEGQGGRIAEGIGEGIGRGVVAVGDAGEALGQGLGAMGLWIMERVRPLQWAFEHFERWAHETTWKAKAPSAAAGALLLPLLVLSSAAPLPAIGVWLESVAGAGAPWIAVAAGGAVGWFAIPVLGGVLAISTALLSAAIALGLLGLAGWLAWLAIGAVL